MVIYAERFDEDDDYEDEEEDEEEEEYDEMDEGFGIDTLKAIVKENGPHVVEVVTCGHCSNKFMSIHPFAERLKCPTCNGFAVSRVPRRAYAGELGVDHFGEAMQIVAQKYGTELLGDGDFDLPVNLKPMVAAKSARQVRIALNEVASLANRLSLADTEGKMKAPCSE